MRKIFSLLSKIKIRVISKQPQDLRVTESNWVVYNYFWTKENLKVFSIFCREPSNKVVINQKENKLVLRWKKLWQITNGEIFPPMLSQGRWIVFREKKLWKKICWNSPFKWLTVTFVHCIGLLRVAVTQLHVRDLSIHWHYVTDGGFAIFGESRKRVVHDGLEIIRHAIINNFSSPFPFGESVFETWRRKTSEW